MSQPEFVTLVNRCFLYESCTTNYTTPQNLRVHLHTSHNFVFPNRLKIKRRRNNKLFWYTPYPCNDKRIKKHFACPCCTAHFDNLNSLSNHFNTDHEDYLPVDEPRPLSLSSGSVSSCSNTNTSSSSNTLPSELSLSDDQHNSLNITATIFMDNHQDQDSTEVGIKRNHDKTLLPDTVSFEPPQGDRLTVRDFDVSEALYQMQLSLKKYRYKLSLEDHLHVIMASASILLLTPYKYPGELKPFIQHDNWLATIKLIQNRYKINRLSMPVNTVANMLATIDQLVTGNINRKGAVHAIDSLSLSAHESMFAAALCSLIRKLPPLAIEEDMNESELCSRFVDPFLSGLFDDPDAGVYLRWTNETTLETKKHGNQDGLRPDMCITKSYGVKWSSSCGYGEAKASKQAEDHHVVFYDLLKVAAFCKNALDKQKFDGILGIQIVGRTIIFYVLLLPATKLYTMLRLAEIKLPDSLQGLPSLVTELPNILGVLDVFDNLCIPAKDIKRAIDCQTSTEPMPLFNLILSSSKDRKRHCHLKLRHN